MAKQGVMRITLETSNQKYFDKYKDMSMFLIERAVRETNLLSRCHVSCVAFEHPTE